MIIDLSDQISRAQVAFGLAVVALLLIWVAFGKLPKDHKKDNRK